MEENTTPEKTPRKKAKTGADADHPFEDALRELEQLAAQMERGDLTLEAAVGAYERGIELSRHCRRKLDEAESKIQKLTKESGMTDFRPEGLEE